MARLAAQADVLTPNLTEACLLTGTPLPGGLRPAPAEGYPAEAGGAGPRRGADRRPPMARISWACWPIPRRRIASLNTAAAALTPISPGTGDLFSSACVGALMRGKPLEEALRLAVDFRCCASKSPAGMKTPHGTGWSLKKHCGISQSCWSDKNRGKSHVSRHPEEEKSDQHGGGGQLLWEARRGILAVNGREGYPLRHPHQLLLRPGGAENLLPRRPCRSQGGSHPGLRQGVLHRLRRRDDPGGGVGAVPPERRGVRPVSPAGQSPETMALLKRFAMSITREQLADEEIRQDGAAAQLFEIEIHHLSGKEVQEK